MRRYILGGLVPAGLLGILSLTVLLVLFLTFLCVMAGMTNVAVERKNDVGLMKAIGGATRRVLRLFLAEAATLGLIAGLIDQVRQQAAALPPAAREKLAAGFQAAAKGGLEVGSGKRASGLSGEIFTHGFVQAMRPTMAAPILFLIAAALSCLLIRRRQSGQAGSARSSEVTEPSATAAGAPFHMFAANAPTATPGQTRYPSIRIATSEIPVGAQTRVAKPLTASSASPSLATTA